MEEATPGTPESKIPVDIKVSVESGGPDEPFVPSWSFDWPLTADSLDEFHFAYRTREVVFDELQPQHTFEWLAEQDRFGESFELGTVTFDQMGEVDEVDLSFEPEEKLD